MRTPPFCPNPSCSCHTTALRDLDWYQHFGSYETKSAGVIPRFRCKYCRRSFSSRTFSIDYYTKRLLNYSLLLHVLASGMSIRALSRYFTATTGTIGNRIDRLARNIIAFHETVLSRLPLTEDLVADGFASFTLSKYFPEDITILVGKRSQFLYFFNQVTLRRSGRMSEQQKRKRELLYTLMDFEENGIEHRFTELLSRLLELLPRDRELTKTALYTDEKVEYERAQKNDPALQHLHCCDLFEHIRIPSTAPRTTSNPLFSANYMDREFRKDLANHHRKTVCFSRNVAASLNRLILYCFYHNYCKPYRIDNAPQYQPLHAEVAGVDPVLLEQKQTVFTQRAFLSLTESISGSFLALWKKQIQTPLKTKPEYVPAYAFA
jgi:hypothetical protein